MPFRQENLCAILKYAMECKDKAVASGLADPDEGASEMPPKKKARTSAEVSKVFTFVYFVLDVL